MNDKHRLVAIWLTLSLLSLTVASATYLAYSKYAVDEIAVRALELNASDVQNERIRREEWREASRKTLEQFWSSNEGATNPRDQNMVPQ